MYKQSALIKKWNYSIYVQTLYSYFRCTVRLFLGFVLFVALRNVALHEDLKTQLQKKLHRRICVRNITTFSTARSSFFVICSFFVDSLSLIKWHTCWLSSIKMHNIPMGCILCDDIMIKGSKVWKSLTI